MLLTRASKNVFRQHRSSADITARSRHVRFSPDCVAKRFCAPKSATLIQDQAAARNIDSKKCSSRFDYCQIATPRRVLQHNPPQRWGNRPAYLWIAEDLGCCLQTDGETRSA